MAMAHLRRGGYGNGVSLIEADMPLGAPGEVKNHQTFQVPKIEESSPISGQIIATSHDPYISCMDAVYVRESPPPKQPYK